MRHSAFYPVAKLTPWARGDVPRLAGVSAFGVGGTNIHMVLQEAPQVAVVDAAALRGPAGLPGICVVARGVGGGGCGAWGIGLRPTRRLMLALCAPR